MQKIALIDLEEGLVRRAGRIHAHPRLLAQAAHPQIVLHSLDAHAKACPDGKSIRQSSPQDFLFGRQLRHPQDNVDDGNVIALLEDPGGLCFAVLRAGPQSLREHLVGEAVHLHSYGVVAAVLLIDLDAGVPPALLSASWKSHEHWELLPNFESQ